MLKPIQDLKAFQKILKNAGEIQPPWISWTEFGQPIDIEDMETEYISTLPNDMLFNCDCGSGSHQLNIPSFVPSQDYREANPPKTFLEIYAHFFKRRFWKPADVFLLIRCWNGNVSLIKFNLYQPKSGKVVCRVPIEIFEQCKAAEIENFRSSKSSLDYRYMWPKPVIGSSHT